MTEPNKFDCYKCLYRRKLPGSAHSSCAHPKVKSSDNEFGDLVNMLNGDFNNAKDELNIKGNPMGIRRGWFLWPANFDPTWLENCDGYTPKEIP